MSMKNETRNNLKEFERSIDNFDFVYAEFDDSPPFDYLAFFVDERNLTLIRGKDFVEERKSTEFPDLYVRRIAQTYERFPEIFLNDKSKEIFGGTWISVIDKKNGFSLRQKLESLSDENQRCILDSISELSKTLNQAGITQLDSSWHLATSHCEDPSKTADVIGKNSSISKLDVHIRVKNAASKLGLVKIEDFKKVSEEDLVSLLGETKEMMRVLRMELKTFGIVLGN